VVEIILSYHPCLWITVLAFLILMVYGSMMLFFRNGWNRIPEHRAPAAEPSTKINVIIPVRNEATHLPRLIQSLDHQEYPKGLYEIIFVDDHSTDNTSALLQERYLKNPHHFTWIPLPNGISGKKAALKTALSQARGELMVQTDGDVLLGKYWLASIAAFYEKHHPLLIIMPVAFTGKSGIFGLFCKLEFAGLMAAAAGSAGAGRPVLCNGANLAYPGEVVAGHPNLFMHQKASGDDMFLLQEMKKRNRHRIRYLKSKHVLVTTPAPASLTELMQQRYRWVSKSSRYSDPGLIAAALLVLITALAPFVPGVCLIHKFNYLLILFTYLLIKSIFDLILLIPFLNYYNLNFKPFSLVLFQGIYPFYVLFSLAGGLSGKFRWKERKFFRGREE